MDTALGLDQDLFPYTGMPLQIISEEAFRIAAAVNIGMVKVIDTVFQRTVHDPVNLLFGKPAHTHTAQRYGRGGKNPTHFDAFHIDSILPHGFPEPAALYSFKGICFS